jgi:hypothetical protein
MSDVLAGLALALSAYATWKTVRFNERQRNLIEIQERLNRRLLEKEDQETEEEKQANLGATFVKLGSTKYCLNIWNRGKAAAHYVQLEFPDGNDCVIEDDIQSKFPLEVLEPFQSVELIAAVGMNTKRKHTIRICWSDAHSAANEKLVYPTL